MSGLGMLLCLAVGYSFAVQPAWQFALVLLAAVVLSAVFGAKRHTVYALLFLLLVWFAGQYCLSIATGPHDGGSDRDEAVEIASRALLRGENPWAQSTGVSGEITTGPASVLIGVPFVLADGDIDLLRFAFWCSFFGCLLWGDLSRRNQSFVGLGLLFLTGILGFHHTMHWSLEELYFGYLILFGAWVAYGVGALSSMGALAGVALMVRLAYAFPVFGLLVWWVIRDRPSPGLLGRFFGGILVGVAGTVVPILLAVGTDVLGRNPFVRASGMLVEPLPSSNLLFEGINTVSEAAGSLGGLLRATLVCGAVGGIAWLLRDRSPSHPFWHIAWASFGGMLLISGFGKAQDYTLFFAIPAFLAVSHSQYGLQLPMEGRD